MKNYIMFIFLLTIVSCEDYVTNIDKPVQFVKDDELNSESQFGFLIAGVKTEFSYTHHVLCGLSDILSDQFIINPESNMIQLLEIDKGNINFDNSLISDGFSALGKLRFYADDLVRRVEEMDVSADSIKNYPLYYGYLFGGISRYYYATYFGLNQNIGGGVIDNGPFVPSSDMYYLAIEKFQQALHTTSDDYEIRLINSLIARAYLYNGDYKDAISYAVEGLNEGDEPFLALYSTKKGNFYYYYMGVNSPTRVEQRFIDYIESDSMETERIQLSPKVIDSITTVYCQVKYSDATSSIPHITWQENNLVIAELLLRGEGSGDALQLVNEVRSSHGLDGLSVVNLDVIYEERDKELFCTGSRLPDQQRFNRWHHSSDKWQYLPIPQDERDINPNIN